MLVTRLIKLYRIEHQESEPPDLIAALSYGTLAGRLAHATEQIIRESATMAQRYPEACIAFSNAAHSFAGGAQLEGARKRRLLGELGIPLGRIVEARPMTNSLQEASAILRAVEATRRPPPQSVLVVTGEIHSRRAAHIWRGALPGAQIFVRCIDTRFECEPQHPMIIQRAHWPLFAVNILHHLALVLPGGARLTSRLRHPSSER